MTPTTTARHACGAASASWGSRPVAVASLASGAIWPSRRRPRSRAARSPHRSQRGDGARSTHRVCPRSPRADRWQRRGDRVASRGRDRLRPRDLRRAFAIRAVVGRPGGPPASGRAAARVGAAARAASVAPSRARGHARHARWLEPHRGHGGRPRHAGWRHHQPTDLRVGDQLCVGNGAADDGSWQVTRIRVLLTTVRGTVASVTTDGFQLTTPDRGNVSVRALRCDELGARVSQPTPRRAARGGRPRGGTWRERRGWIARRHRRRRGGSAAAPPWRGQEPSGEPSPAPVGTPGA